jgi:hypothetical protein
MKKIYVFTLCIVSLATVVFFQNCSKAQISAVQEQQSDKTVDSAISTFDVSAKFSITSSLNQQDNFRTIYEYKIAGGNRRPCSTEDDYLDGFEERCANASGFRVLSDGTLLKFFQFLDRKEIQYNVGYYDENQLKLFLARISEIQKTNAKLVDLNEGGPICADLPLVTQVLFNDQNDLEFVLAKREDCHEFARNEDLSAVKLASTMERLYRRLVTIKSPQMHILIEKRLQIGFRPPEMPGDVSVRIYSDGRVVKKSVFNEARTQLKLITILSNQQIEELNKALGQVYGYKFELKDLAEGAPMCTDAPTVTYSFHELLNHSFDVRQIQEAYHKVDFAKEAHCHSFGEAKLVEQSAVLINFINQFD